MRTFWQQSREKRLKSFALSIHRIKLGHLRSTLLLYAAVNAVNTFDVFVPVFLVAVYIRFFKIFLTMLNIRIAVSAQRQY